MSHANSLIHIQAQEAKAAKNQPSELQKGFSKIEIDNCDKMCKLFSTAYYIAINEKPFSDFPGLIDLQLGNGIQLAWPQIRLRIAYLHNCLDPKTQLNYFLCVQKRNKNS